MMRLRLSVFAFGLLVVFGACQNEVSGPLPVPVPPPPPVPETVHRFLAVGDQGMGDANQQSVAAAMKTRLDAEGADFLILLGDNFYQTGVTSISDPQWQTKFEDVYGSWGIPVYAVLGNHDYGGSSGAGPYASTAVFEVNYTGTQTLAGGTTAWTMPGPSYGFEFGPASFSVLDTNAIKMNAASDPGTLAQAADLESRFGAATGWKIAFGHHPYWSNGTHGDAGSYDKSSTVTGNGKTFQTWFAAQVVGKADLYFCGHDHSLQALRLPGQGPRLLVVGGGGGSLTGLPGLHRADFEDPSFGFVAVDYDSHVLHYRFFDENGSLLFQDTLSR